MAKKKAPSKAPQNGRSEAEWQELISLFDASGLRQVDFCEEMGLDPKQFSYQRHKRMPAKAQPKAKAPAAAAGWVEVVAEPNEPAAPPVAPASSVTVRVGGCEIEVSAGFDARLLRDVCKALACPA